MRTPAPPLWFLAAFVLALAPVSAEAAIVRGPYLQDLRPDGILVVMEGDALGTPTVGYGLSDPSEDSATCTCTAPQCVCSLTGLDPATEYVYEVRGTGGALSDRYRFRTAPTGIVDFAFAVFGDNRSDHSSHDLVVRSMTEDFDFVLNTGDMVSSGEVEADWDKFFEIERSLLATRVLFPSVGNHEEHDGEAEIFERVFHPPAGPSGSTSETYYAFTYSNVRFVIVDDFVRVDPWFTCILRGKVAENCLQAKQEEWLEKTVTDAAADPAIEHVFIFVHQGPYTSKPNRTGSAEMREWLARFAANKVKILFSGHDHYYEHGISGNGMHYVITGGGGAPLYETAPSSTLMALYPHEILVSESVHNYQMVRVAGRHIEVVTHNVDTGEVLERFEIGIRTQCDTPADCEIREAGACAGSWSCPGGQCVWVCDPAPKCATAADCPDPPEGSCAGRNECLSDGSCRWICATEPECQVPVDCAQLEPLNDCPGGHYLCTDSVCEWVCAHVEQPDAGTEPPALAEEDGGGSLTPSAPAEADEGGGGSSVENTSGCRATSGAAPLADLYALLLVLFASRLVRRRYC